MVPGMLCVDGGYALSVKCEHTFMDFMLCESSSKSIEGSTTLQIQNLSRTVLLISSVLNTVEVFAARSMQSNEVQTRPREATHA